MAPTPVRAPRDALTNAGPTPSRAPANRAAAATHVRLGPPGLMSLFPSREPSVGVMHLCGITPCAHGTGPSDDTSARPPARDRGGRSPRPDRSARPPAGIEPGSLAVHGRTPAAPHRDAAEVHQRGERFPPAEKGHHARPVTALAAGCARGSDMPRRCINAGNGSRPRKKDINAWWRRRGTASPRHRTTAGPHGRSARSVGPDAGAWAHPRARRRRLAPAAAPSAP
jgi:hypothetical protein